MNYHIFVEDIYLFNSYIIIICSLICRTLERICPSFHSSISIRIMIFYFFLQEGPRTMVGIATFDSAIHFYNLKRILQQVNVYIFAVLRWEEGSASLVVFFSIPQPRICIHVNSVILEAFTQAHVLKFNEVSLTCLIDVGHLKIS